MSFEQDTHSRSPLLDEDFVNEEHVQAFAQALSANDAGPIEGDVSPFSPRSPRSPPAGLDAVESATGIGAGTSRFKNGNTSWRHGPDHGYLSASGGHERVEKLTATSDFAPIHQKVSRRATSSHQGLSYHLIRWPLLGFILLIIAIEFYFYIGVRQIVNLFEYLLAWRGKKGTLRAELRRAQSYEEWKQTAKQLDQLLKFDDWKEIDEDGYFDFHLVRRVKRTLTRLRAAKDTRGLMDALSVCVRSNFAGTESVKMYAETFYGTKLLVEAHIREVAASLDFVRNATDVSQEEKRAFFRSINKNYGSSALCLSGGASFGYYHFGVIKAFLDADLLPRVVTGTSAGGLVAALLCTRTNDELKELLVPELADRITACEDSFMVWVRRWWTTGARFSSVEWAKKAMFFTHGSLTFKEAYERTGRALNVSVVPSDRHSPTILLNHLTAPNCLIWSAIIASAAVPGILNPVVLMKKDRNGQISPHNLGGSRFKDGSLREDIPLGSLHTQFNCNFSIVSQTNPHIHLFFFAPRGAVGRPVAHRKGKGWRGGFLLSAIEAYVKLDLSKHFKVIRDLDLLPQILQSDWSGVFLQRFSGDLTLTPRSTVGDWFHLLSDPSTTSLARMIDVGQRVTWPALHMVSNRMSIERAILRGRAEVRSNMQREKTSNDKGSPIRNTGDLTPVQVPIESDADAGFARRTRKLRASRSHPTARGIFDESKKAEAGSSSLRQRKGQGQLMPPVTVRDLTDAAEAASGTTTPGSTVPPPPKSYAETFGDTFRHVRASSYSALTSPFRNMRGLAPESHGDADEDKRRASASQMSFSKWFGGGESSSSEDEGEYDASGDRFRGGSPGSASAGSRTSGDERRARIPSLTGSEGLDDDVIDDEDDEDDERSKASARRYNQDVEPVPGGEPVSKADIQASALVNAPPSRVYSPPSQDLAP